MPAADMHAPPATEALPCAPHPSTINQVVLAASERGRDHIPYRSCKLTHVLRDSIGGNCRTVLIANVWGDAAQLDETLSTCRCACPVCSLSRAVCHLDHTSAVVLLDNGHGLSSNHHTPKHTPNQVCRPHGQGHMRGDAQRGPGGRGARQAAGEVRAARGAGACC